MFNFVNTRPLRALQLIEFTSLAAALNWHRKMKAFNFQHVISRITEELDGNTRWYSKICEVPEFHTFMAFVGYCKRACSDWKVIVEQ